MKQSTIYLLLSTITLVTSTVSGLLAALINDFYADYTGLVHFFTIKATVAGIVSLILLLVGFSAQEEEKRREHRR